MLYTGVLMLEGSGMLFEKMGWNKLVKIQHAITLPIVIVGVVLKLSNDLLAQGRITAPLLTEGQVSSLVMMVFITTLVCPMLLRWALRRASV